MTELENEFIKFYIEDEILNSIFIKPTIINVENAKKLIDLRHQISNNKKQYWCYDIKGLKSMDKTGRDYANTHGQDQLHACAVITHSHVSQFIFNTFLMIKKPKTPFKAFNDRESAIAWLRKIKNKNEL